MATDLRKTGIDVISQMPWGTHFCLFYENQDDLLNVVVPYLKAGLEDNEFCVWVVADPLTEEDAWRALSQAVPAFERHRSKQSIELLPARDWYLNVGHFELERVTSAWNRKLTQALARGYAGMRVSGDTLWLEKKTWKGFLEYENQLDKSITDQLMTILCTYPLTSSSAAEILDVARSHQFTLARRGGAWEVIETPELKQAKAEIKSLNEQLERRVVERTVQLAASNEQLKLELIERKQAEDLLHAREQEFRVIVENAPDQIIRYDKEFRRTYVNPAVTQAYGLPREAFIGKPVGSVVEDAGLEPDIDAVTAIRQRIKSVFDTGEPTEYEVTFPSPGGRRTYWTRMYPEFDPNGVVIHVLSISRETTDRKQADEALRRSESNFRTLADKSLEGIQLYQGGKSVYANAAMTALLGYTQEELRAMSMEEHIALVHPLDRAIAVERARRRQASQEVPASLEVRILTKAGATRWVQGFTNEIEYNGQPAILSTTIDITERKRAEEELRTQKEILQKIFDHSPMMIGSIGTDGKWLMVNQAWEHTMGWTLEELQQPNFDVLAEIYPDPGEHQRVLDFIAAPAGEWTDFKARARDGRVLDVTFTNVRLSDGTTLGFGLDITERKQAETAIRSLLQISEKLHSTLDIDALLDSLIIEAMQLIDAEIGWSGLRTEEGMVLHTHISRDLQVVSFPYLWPPEVGLPGWVLVHKAPYVMHDAQSDTMIIPEIRERFDVKAAIDTPILDAEGEVIGFFEVNNKKNGARFSDSDVETLVAVSRIASIALQNARLFEAVSEHRQQLLVLSARLAEAQETERRAIARELHDEFGQSLTALKIDLAWLHDHLPPRSKGLGEKVDSALELTNETIQMTQRLAGQLRPRMLDDLGLAAALEWHVNEWSKHTRIKAKVTLPEEEWELDPSLNTALYRVCQEALTNVARHAGAKKVEVSLAREGDEVVLTVRDNGRGMDGGKITAPESLGLLGMKERVEQIGGRLEIQSEAGKGTTVVARVPVSQSSSPQPSEPSPKSPKKRRQAGKTSKKTFKGKESHRRKS
jgi:PAS domain S-box-containing protein